jgi:hypothetical protein
MDLWPYVNGRALVNGLQLASMEFSDMLDVFHYFLEDDMNYSTAEQADARDKTRSSIYSDLYNTKYRYAAEKASIYASGSMDFDAPQGIEPEIEPFEPKKKPKPYLEPTSINANAPKPFGDILDSPLEH